jgi:UPF0755 protein
MKVLKIVGIVILLGLIISGIFGYRYYNMIFMQNVPNELKTDLVKIPTGSDFDEVVKILKTQGVIEDEMSFRWVANQMNYIKNPMREGQYKIEAGISNKRLISILRGYRQTPVQFVIHNKRVLPQIAGACGKGFEADSLDFLAALMDESFWEEYGYNLETAMSTFIPNTYQLYWTTTPQEFCVRMIKEHDTFWEKNNRKAKAKTLGFSQEEIYTLASIVETESQHKPERPRIAGVYVNRLERGIPLQADPSVVFAWKDFTIRRILNYHLEIESPYNTYKYAGLPPGPIYMSSISSIDAVLNAEKHNYLYFCAKPDLSRTHNYAKTLSAHNVNARNYHRWLNQQGIKK